MTFKFSLIVKYIAFLWLMTAFLTSGKAQRISQLDSERVQLVYFGKRYTYLSPHVLRSFNNAMDFHSELWDYDPGKIYVVLNDFQDYGNGGAITMPMNQVFIGIGPYNFAFSIIPSSERFQWLFNHELAHIVMTDKPNSRDLVWRKAFFGKVRREDKAPLSAIWSYTTTPRWYAPRWYQEGIAIFMETFMGGGMGRSMGYYDEMYFRSLVHEEAPIHSVVGLETEGSAVDFQVGANAYLYGTRFVNYLAIEYGLDKLIDFYLRSEDSKAFYARQFRQVYGISVREAWNNWIEYERGFQQDNIESISEYPLTDFSPITRHPLGNVSNYRYNPETQKLYAVINHPGIISQLAEIDINSGDIRKIARIDGPALYYSAFLAYDPELNRVFVTEQNNKYRSLVSIDVESGRKTTLIPFSRTGDLVFNPADRSLWGVRTDNGYSSLVHIPEPYQEIHPLYVAPFGQAIFDLDIASDGSLLSATLSGIQGEQKLVVFETAALMAGNTRYRVLHELEDNTLTQFKFSPDNQWLVGASYFTGVSNIWRVHINDGRFELLSNTETGYFMPLPYAEDSLFVLRFYRDGMLPGRIPLEVLHAANAIEFMGNRIIERNPVLEEWSLPPPAALDTGLIQEKPFRPLAEMRLTNAWPDISAFKNTVVGGYRMQWRDQTGLSTMDLFLGASPWSSYRDKQKLHAELLFSYWNWKLNASWNKTDFYDLFGPTRRSRAGYSVSLTHEFNNSLRDPFRWSYRFGIYTYGDLEVLPQHQNIASPLRDFQAATGGLSVSRLRRSLGGVDDELGYKWDLSAVTYYAKGTLYPSLISSQDIGFLIPGLRNTSFWLRHSLGQAFGSRGSAFSAFYLGGFRNNYVDWRNARQYRSAMAFPGAEIDAISARSYSRSMAELNLRPWRTRNVGATWLYPTFIQTSLFGTHLLTDPFETRGQRHLFNAGIQTDIEVVMFSYLKTTWSAGYARMMEAGKQPSGQWLLSLKLLGN